MVTSIKLKVCTKEPNFSFPVKMLPNSKKSSLSLKSVLVRTKNVNYVYKSYVRFEIYEVHLDRDFQTNCYMPEYSSSSVTLDF